MKRTLTLAACALLLAGCDLVDQISGPVPDPVALTSLTITSARLTPDEDGSGPDLFVEVQDIGGNAVFVSPILAEDITEDAFPLIIPASGELTGTTRTYTLAVLDRDPDGNRLIAASRGFSADDLRESASNTLELANRQGTLQASITRAR